MKERVACRFLIGIQFFAIYIYTQVSVLAKK